MSHSVVLPPVHETSPPPFDDDADDNDIFPTTQHDESVSSTSPDVLNNSNEDWKSVDDNDDTDIAQIQDDVAVVDNENNSTNIKPLNEESTQEENNHNDDDDDDGWANFATFENKTDEVSEIPPPTISAVVEETTENDWANFASNTVSTPEPSIQSFDDEPATKIIDDEDDDFGEFSEVQVAASKPPTASLPTNTLTPEQIESLISTCFPMESTTPIIDENSLTAIDLPSFTTHRDPTKQIPYLQSSLSLWNVLSNLSNDPIGIQFQWRKSHTERFFHHALGVNERFRTKNVPLTPEILQPEKVKSTMSANNESENIENENKLSNESIRPHFDWKQSGLQNPLTDNDSSSLSSNVSKTEDNVFDANKTLDLDFYVPSTKSSNETEHSPSPVSIPRNDSPIIQSQQKHAIPIKTVDLFPGSTTTLTDDAKRIIDTLPNLSFMSAKALMFPVRFNANNNDELY